MEVIALKPASCSWDFKKITNDQAIVAGDKLLLAGIGERFLDT